MNVRAAEWDAPVVVVGVPVVDMVAYVDEFPSPGGHSPGSSLTVMPGGPAVNVATAVARLGHAALLLGKIGTDAWGELLQSASRHNSVYIPQQFVVPGQATAAVLVIYDGDGTGEMRSFSFRKNTADVHLTPDDLTPHLFERAKVLFVDGILALNETLTQAGEAASELAMERKLRIFCDPNLRVPGQSLDPEIGRRVGRLFALADEVLLNESEARLLLAYWGDVEAAQGDGFAMGRALAAKYPSVSVWVLKLGSDGAIVFEDGQSFVQPIFPVNVSDTSGAGDSFAGAWISAYLEGMNKRGSARRAAAVAALTVSGKGAWASLPDRQSMQQFLDAKGFGR